MSRSDKQRLQEIKETASKLQIIAEKGERNFHEDFQAQWAIERGLQTIGECATHLSAEYKDTHPEVLWSEIIGMRTQLAHAYHAIDPEIVWNAASVSVPELIRALSL
jgi:uncharacterized protein with HEPN domain